MMRHDDTPFTDYEPSNPAWHCLDTDARGEVKGLVFGACLVAFVVLVIWLAR